MTINKISLPNVLDDIAMVLATGDKHICANAYVGDAQYKLGTFAQLHPCTPQTVQTAIYKEIEVRVPERHLNKVSRIEVGTLAAFLAAEKAASFCP